MVELEAALSDGAPTAPAPGLVELECDGLASLLAAAAPFLRPLLLPLPAAAWPARSFVLEASDAPSSGKMRDREGAMRLVKQFEVWLSKIEVSLTEYFASQLD